MDKEEIIQLLDELQVDYRLIEHPAVYTIEEMDALELPDADAVVKNLFLRDDKKREYYVLVVRKDKKINLKELRDVLNSRPLSFASEQDLLRYLGLTKGAVTPLGVLNDPERKVRVLIDADVMSFDVVGIHPNENTATIWLSPQDLQTVVENHGNDFRLLTL